MLRHAEVVGRRRHFGVKVVSTAREPRAMADKKRKLTHDWFASHLSDVSISADDGNSVAATLSQVPEDDLCQASAETLAFYLHEKINDDTKRRIVAGRMHHRIRTFCANEPAPRHQHCTNTNLCSLGCSSLASFTRSPCR